MHLVGLKPILHPNVMEGKVKSVPYELETLANNLIALIRF